MVRLQAGNNKNRRHGSRKLAESIKNILGLQRHAFSKLFTVNFRGRAHFSSVLPRSGRVRMKRAAGAELAPADRFHGCTHIGVMWRAEAFHDPFQAGRVGIRPVFIGIVSKSQARGIWIAARAQQAERIDAVEHPASKPHCLKHQSACVATDGKFDGDFRKGPLLHKGQRRRVICVHNIAESSYAGNGPPVYVVRDHRAVLQQVAQIEQKMLCKVADGDDDKRSGLIDHPSIVRGNMRLLARQNKPTILDLPDPCSQGIKDCIKVK